MNIEKKGGKNRKKKQVFSDSLIYYSQQCAPTMNIYLFSVSVFDCFCSVRIIMLLLLLRALLFRLFYFYFFRGIYWLIPIIDYNAVIVLNGWKTDSFLYALFFYPQYAKYWYSFSFFYGFLINAWLTSTKTNREFINNFFPRYNNKKLVKSFMQGDFFCFFCSQFIFSVHWKRQRSH